jgi:isoleucyl-tRNA synthetase
MLPGGGFVVLDTAVTPELAQEGLARDVIRAVQQARRDAGLEVSDRISLTVTGGETVWRAVVAHQELIMTETLAQQFGSAGQLDALPQRTDVTDATVADGEPVRIKVMKLAG